jgi:hypothetical protein
MPISDYPNGFPNGVAIRDMPVLNAYTGKAWWVCSPTSPSAGGSNTTHGARGGFNNPYPSLATAVLNQRMVAGDIICVKAQHAETITAPIIPLVACTILGLGTGNLRPQFTMNLANAALYGIQLNYAGSTISNLYFPISLSALAGAVFLNAAECAVYNSIFFCGASDTNSIVLGLAANTAKIYNNEFFLRAAGPVHAINIPSGPLRVEIRWNLFDGLAATSAWSGGGIYCSGSASVDRVTNNDFLYMYASAGGVNFGANVKGLIRDNFFGGGSLTYSLINGGCYCANNYSSSNTSDSAELFPTGSG